MYAKTALLVLVAGLAYASAKETKTVKDKHLEILFDMLDADNDARITLNEAEEFFENIGLDDIAIGKAFKKADKNGDSTVTLKEFKEYAKDISVPNKEDLLELTFDVIDTSDNNYITLDEAKEFYSALGIPAAHIEATFKAIDKDGDGKISLEEFKKHQSGKI